MGEKSGGGATTAEERDDRVRYAVARICTSTDDVESATAIVHKFGCGRPTANKYIRAARKLVGAGLPAEIEGWRTLARSTILWLLNKPGEDAASIRATLKMMIDLLGLAAPTKIDATVSSVPFDPIAAYAADPALRDRALQLERDIADADKTLGTVDPGADRNSGMAVSAPHPSTGNGRAGHPQQSGAEPAGD